jgi:hexulose-6-phosphate isomerase
MKKAISTWSFYGDWNLKEKLSLARAAGFSGFEPELTEAGDLALDGSPGDWKKVRVAADAAGIEISGLATGLYWGANGASKDPEVRARAAHILERQIRCAEAIGTDTILLVPAAVGVDFIPGCEVVPYADAYARATELIEKALPLAKECGVTIAVENVWNKFLLSPLEFKGFIEQFNSPLVAAYFDVGNALATGYPEDWIRILGSLIARVHFKDFRRNVGSVDGFVDLLSGDVNWPEVVSSLRAVDYQGWVAAEMIPPVPFYRHAPEVLISNTSRAMDAIFSMSEEMDRD